MIKLFNYTDHFGLLGKNEAKKMVVTYPCNNHFNILYRMNYFTQIE